MVSSSWDYNIKVWNSNPPYNLISTLTHTIELILSIHYLQERNKLISVDKYQTKIWNMKTYQLESIIKGVSTIGKNSICQIENTIFLGDKGKIVLLNLDTFTIKQSISYDNNWFRIFSVLQLSKNIILCGGDGAEFLYDISNNTITKYYTPYSVGVSSLVQFKENIIIESFYSIGLRVLKIINENK